MAPAGEATIGALLTAPANQAAVAVAGLSVRAMAESARRAGRPALALDLFGDLDTQRAASRWIGIGNAAELRIDAERLLAALHDLAARREVVGWIAGSGFEGRSDLLEEGGRQLPLLGTAPAALRRLRDPATFFAALEAFGIRHPPTCTEPPRDGACWLFKDSHACGGWHVRDAADAPGRLAAGQYFQRLAPGRPMSASFVADGRQALRLGFNRLLPCRIGAHRFVHGGVIGPLTISAPAAAAIDQALARLTPAFGLRGLGSIDFMLDGQVTWVLEVNARVPASAELYDHRLPGGMLAVHQAACRGGLGAALLAAPPAAFAAPDSAAPVRGSRIVFARSPLSIDARAAALIAGWPGAHDLPRAGIVIASGTPVCSLAAGGRLGGNGESSELADAVEAELDHAHEQLLTALEGGPETR